MPSTQPIKSERQRKLQQLTFVPSSLLSRDLPKDTVLKHLLLRLSGSITTTFGSGTPVADEFGAFDDLVYRIDIRVNGRTIKNVKPYLMHMQQLLTTLVQGERCASAAASAATDNYPTVDVTAVPYGTTGQVTTCREAVMVSFENVYARSGKEKTWLRTKGASQAEVVLNTSAYSSLLGFGNTAPVVYSASTFAVDLYTIEQPGTETDGVQLWDWRQTTQQVTFTAQVTNSPITINKGNFLQAIMMLTRDGAAGSSTTASGKLRSNLAVTNFALWVGGDTIVKAGDFKHLQAENRIRFGVNAPFASNISRMDGCAYLDLLSDDGRGDLNTAVDVRPGVADSVFLYVDTNTSANVSYTNPISIELMTEEIVKSIPT